MTPQEQTKLLEILITMSGYYGRTLTDPVLRIYVDGLKEFPLGQVLYAIETFHRNPKNRFMPLIADILSIMDPASAVTEKDEGNILANKLQSLVEKRGTTWMDLPEYHDGKPLYQGSEGQYYETFTEALTSYIGQTGFEVVRTVGGWRTVCENFNGSDHAIVKAQLRDLTESCIRKLKAGTLHTPLGLPETNHKELPSIVKQLAEKKGLDNEN